MIEDERNGKKISQDVIRKSLIILINLGIKTTRCYKKDFENDFFKNTVEYYR